MRISFLLFLLAAALCAQSQPSVPTLLNLHKDTVRYNMMDISPKGNSVGWRYYQYCTNVVCFNDGIQFYMHDSLGNTLGSVQLEKPSNEINTASKVMVRDMIIDHEENVIIAGSIHSNVIFSPNGPGTTVVGGSTIASNASNIFIAKYTMSGALIWVKKLDDIGSTYPGNVPMAGFMHLAVDGSNNIYLYSMKAYGTFDLDPGTPSVPVSGSVLVKYSKNGAYLTHKAADDISTQLYKSLTFQNNKLYLATHADSAGKQTILLRQFDPATLQIVKSKKFGLLQEDNTSNGYVKNIQLAFNGNDIWMLASHIGTLDFPAGGSATLSESLSFGERGFFLAKLDANWNVTAARLIDKTKYSYAPMKIGFDGGNNMLLVGAVSDSIDVDLGPAAVYLKPQGATNTVGYMAYYDASLNLQWGKTFCTGNTFISIDGVGFGDNRKIYITGDFRGTGDFSLIPPAAMHSSTAINMGYDTYYARYHWATASATGVDRHATHGAFFRLYPNPCSDRVNIESSLLLSAGATVSVLDAAGRVLAQYGAVGQAKQELPTSMLAPGSYFILVRNASGQFVQAFRKL